MTAEPWGDADLTADDRKAYRQPCRCATCQDALHTVASRVTTVAPEPVPARSPIGTGVGVVLGLALMVLGIGISLTTPPMSGGTVAAILAVAMGGAVLIRIAIVTRSRS